jgi:chromate transporter
LTNACPNESEQPTLSVAHPSFREAFLFWLKLGFISFGGPAGQIAIMQTELVEKKRWIGQARFLHALNFCMLLPGPEATQLAIYIGWLLHRTHGGIVAGALFVLPSMVLLWTLSFVYAAYGHVLWIAAIFYGLKPAVIAIVTAAVIRIGRKALKNEVMWSIAVLAFVAIFFFQAPFPLIILAAGVVGLVGGKVWALKFEINAANPEAAARSVLSDTAESLPHTRFVWSRARRVLFGSLVLWFAPLIAIGFSLGTGHVLFQEGLFFSKAAVVTFGGAYAVLPYVAQQAVSNYGWLQPGQMMDGLGLAETTPGPLIIVLQFVGFMGAWNHPGNLPPLVAATAGALLTTWVTFVPCFLWIFLGAPYVERLRGNRQLTAALSTITAAVVGVIINLAVWFGMHALFPGGTTIDWLALAIAIVAFIGILRWHWDIIPVVLGAGAIGIVTRLVSILH